MSLFRLIDLQRLGGTGKNISECHRSLFSAPVTGSVYDRESVYLTSKSAPPAVGTIGDRWRKYLSVPVGVRLGEAFRSLASLP
jgi:hypothetical protein